MGVFIETLCISTFRACNAYVNNFREIKPLDLELVTTNETIGTVHVIDDDDDDDDDDDSGRREKLTLALTSPWVASSTVAKLPLPSVTPSIA